MNISVVGFRASVNEPGKLAAAILEAASQTGDVVRCVQTPSEGADGVIFCRSSEDGLIDAVRYCVEHDIPLLVLSTGLDLQFLNDVEGLRWSYLPNSNPEVQRYVELLKNDIKGLEGKVSEWLLEEHHQKSKKDVSGTALLICEELGLRAAGIISVRDIVRTNDAFGLELQEGQPYACHRFWAENELGEQTPVRDIVVTNHLSYGLGALEAIRAL